MSEVFTEAWMYGWRPAEHSGNVRYADYKFIGDDIEFVELSERAGDLKDTAKVEIHNPNAKYTDTDAFAILQHGDRIEFQTRVDRNLRAFGTGSFGTGVFQPDLRIRWTGIIRNFDVTAEGRHIYSLEFEAEDYVYAIMSLRRVTNAWTEEQILTGSGSGQGIINTILENECPEIDLSELPSLPDTTTISLGDKNVLESVVELANRAGLIMWADSTTLRLEKPDDIATSFEMDATDYTLWSFSSNDDQLYNRIRVEGGRSHEPDPVAQQTQQDAWETVTKASRHQHQVTARKGEVDRIELWTDPSRTGSEEDYIVRLQKDDGGAPVAPEDTKSDIARKKLSHHFTSKSGWTTFILPQHKLPDPNPWVIIESSGETGQDIGIRGSDSTLSYITHYPYNIRTRRDSVSSQNKYRLREQTISDSSFEDLPAARDAGDATLHRHEEPDAEFEFEADSQRLHDAAPGDIVRLSMDQVDAAGRFVVMERNIDWADNLESATITLRDLASL